MLLVIPHIAVLSLLVFTLFLGLSPLIIGHEALMEKLRNAYSWKVTSYNQLKGIALALVMIIVIFNYRNIVDLISVERVPIFTSEYDLWLVFAFPIIPFLWLYANFRMFLFPIITFGVSIFSGLILHNMHEKNHMVIKMLGAAYKADSDITALQRFCDMCYKVVAILFFCNSFIMPITWLLLLFV